MSFSSLLHRCFAFAFIIATIAPEPALAQDSDQGGWRFGVIESYDSPSHADRLGVGWTRVTFHWAEVQPDGVQSWTPGFTDEQIEAEIAAGRMVVGLLIGIPDWARAEDRLPQGLWAAHDDPANSWANYVRQAVSKYKGRIDHWIIWNEPDIRQGELAHTWDGSVADFAQLQRSAYLAAKEANPRAVIHLPAFTYWADYVAGSEQYMALLLDQILADPQAMANNYYFDVATAHLYFQPGQIYDLLGLFTNIMRERGLQQPIWLVETNAPPKNDPDWLVPNWTLSVTQQEQAAFMPQALASALAAGAERIAVYKLMDTQDDRAANPEPFGLVRRDSSERPAFATYRLAIGYLSGALRAERERWDEIGQIRVDQEDQTTTVLFSRLPEWQRVDVTATDEIAQLVDMWGTKQIITPTTGIYTINLPPASCSQSIADYCMIGGPNYYLVQSAEVLLPAATQSSTETPFSTETPSSTDSPRPTATVMPSVTTSKTIFPTLTATDAKPATATPFAVTIIMASSPRPAASPSSPAGQTTMPDVNDTPDYLLPLALLGGGIVLIAGLGLMLLRRK